MKNKNFFQVIMLVIFIGIVFYIVFPKYEFFYKKDDKVSELTNYFRCNKITGKIEISNSANEWISF